MKKYFFLFLATALGIAACTSNNTDQAASDSSAVDTTIASTGQQTCYAYVKDKDTAKLTLMTSGNIATGKLNYNLYEKDKNNGTFEGEFRGDTLVADYKFNSEGKESVRQLVFLKKGDQLVEGFSDVEEKNGKMIFTNIGSIKFEDAMVFNKVECY